MTVNFSCPIGQILTGPKTSTCLANREWEPDSNEGTIKCYKVNHQVSKSRCVNFPLIFKYYFHFFSLPSPLSYVLHSLYLLQLTFLLTCMDRWERLECILIGAGEGQPKARMYITCSMLGVGMSAQNSLYPLFNAYEICRSWREILLGYGLKIKSKLLSILVNCGPSIIPPNGFITATNDTIEDSSISFICLASDPDSNCLHYHMRRRLQLGMSSC